MRKTEKIILGIIVLSFAIGIFLYPQMPDQMASHWDDRGQVDDYMSKFWGLFLLPFTSVFLCLLFVSIPKIDPLKVNIEKFRDYYDGFVAFMIIFLFYIYLLTVLWNVGIRFNMSRLLAPAMGVLFYYCGILIKNTKRNWFIGIRTPWTLSSEKVWDKTHQIGGKLFKIAGIIALSGAFFQKYALFLVLAPVISVSIYTIVYSYFEYQKEIK